MTAQNETRPVDLFGRVLQVLSALGLILSIAPAILAVAKTLDLGTAKHLFSLGMVFWFGAALVGSRRAARLKIRAAANR
jgi:hypothetical protein